ncbi:DUF2474 domain-containing protein [Bosea sp. BIWAKO-01]|nr:DUF2474 domain-containing protein [Bosea sp. BIWAKO-01]GAU82028.1 hypothetical protein BIWAKO_01930 [Bosea sp. BIWAKO-01]
MAPVTSPRKPWLNRFGWLVLIWGASVLTLGIVALGFRLLMKAAGLSL